MILHVKSKRTEIGQDTGTSVLWQKLITKKVPSYELVFTKTSKSDEIKQVKGKNSYKHIS